MSLCLRQAGHRWFPKQAAAKGGFGAGNRISLIRRRVAADEMTCEGEQSWLRCRFSVKVILALPRFWGQCIVFDTNDWCITFGILNLKY